MDETPHVHINTIDIDGEQKCEISTYGNTQVLASLIYSGMLSNEYFAEIVMIAAMNYTKKKMPPEAILN